MNHVRPKQFRIVRTIDVLLRDRFEPVTVYALIKQDIFGHSEVIDFAYDLPNNIPYSLETKERVLEAFEEEVWTDD